MSTPPAANVLKFFRFDVRDVSEHNGWRTGSLFEARAETFTVTVVLTDGNPATYEARLRYGQQELLNAGGDTPQHALDLLQSKVRMLRTALESLTAP